MSRIKERALDRKLFIRPAYSNDKVDEQLKLAREQGKEASQLPPIQETLPPGARQFYFLSSGQWYDLDQWRVVASAQRLP